MSGRRRPDELYHDTCVCVCVLSVRESEKKTYWPRGVQIEKSKKIDCFAFTTSTVIARAEQIDKNLKKKKKTINKLNYKNYKCKYFEYQDLKTVRMSSRASDGFRQFSKIVSGSGCRYK